MNRIIKRAGILLVLVLVLAAGTLFFLGEYFFGAGKWVMSAGSPHVYNAANLGCGVVTDKNGILLLDMTGGRTYSDNLLLRQSTIHWLGDRNGNISAPALPYYAQKVVGFDPIGGVYSYGGTGGTVKLTLSARVQAVAQEAMGDYKGTVAVYNYKTGQLLCAVTTPNYDPDNVPDISEDENGTYQGVYLNRFVQSSYTPGSIYKIVTAAAALEEIDGIEDQVFTCNGVSEYGIDRVTCLKEHGSITFKDAFAQSCNCAFAQIADQLGGEKLQKYARQFGITDSVTFDGITTVSGKLEAEGEAPVMVAWSAIGQHKDLVNPCRFMTFVGAIGNGGVSVEPYLVENITVGSKKTHTGSGKDAGRLMSEDTAAMLQELMANNVQVLYGAENFPGLTVCAKSGTAEVGGDKKPNAMFTGFLADEEYPLAFIAAVEDAGYGRQVCVPILSKVLQECKAEIDGN